MNTPTSSSDKTYILVHGAWYGGGWCWHKVVPLLESRGYAVIPVDLPGYGQDTTPAASVTLDDYVTTVLDVAGSVKGKVVLVGHSLGGAVISQASEFLGPEKAEKLVYVDAFLLRNGESILAQVQQLAEASKAAPEPAAEQLAADYLIFSDDQKTCLVDPARMQEVFCHDAPAEDVALAKANLRWQPVAGLATPISVTDERYGVIPKVYIRCTKSRDLDRRSIVQHVPCQQVFELPSSHSPFFSMPDRLAAILEEVY
ncbi:alpha/beta fold hydrolase [Nibrella viscosa]